MVVSSASGNDDDTARFAERFALTMLETGLPRMPARVFAALLIAPDARLTAASGYRSARRRSPAPCATSPRSKW
jgi:hypothetical protein